MPRFRRVDFQGATYHVMHRGNNKQHIFREDIDKGYFLKKVREYQQELGFVLLAYVLMDNHYHLLLRTNSQLLSSVMHHINSNYAHFFNHKYQQSGHVFQGRYHSPLILDNNHLLSVLRYIHLNPVQAGLCSAPHEYKWSSDGHYRSGGSYLVNVKEVFQMLSSAPKQAQYRYQEFMADSDAAELYIDIDSELRFADPDFTTPNLDAILSATCPDSSTCVDIKAKSRKRSLRPHKVAFISQALAAGYTQKDIAKYLQITSASISMLLKT